METLTIKLEKTCHACPEQYDMYINDEYVGYFRLRHGGYTVQCPDVGGSLVYEGRPIGDGMFDELERPHYLMAGIRAVLNHVGYKKLSETFKDEEDTYYSGPDIAG